MLSQEPATRLCNNETLSERMGYVHSTESFGSVDGPGVRFIIFLAGCPMRCAYCHNPDTWDMSKGQKMTADELLQKALRYKTYWKKEGGITVSGGEALMQIDFLIDLFEKAKAKGVNTCIDTSGAPFSLEEPFISKFDRLCELTDLFMLDIKHIDDDIHKELTGRSNKNILEMAKYLSDRGKKMWIRQVLLERYTDDDEYLRRTREFIDTLKTVERVEVLPYHTLGTFKYENLGIPYKIPDINPPSGERVLNAEKILGAK